MSGCSTDSLFKTTSVWEEEGAGPWFLARTDCGHHEQWPQQNNGKLKNKISCPARVHCLDKPLMWTHDGTPLYAPLRFRGGSRMSSPSSCFSCYLSLCTASCPLAFIQFLSSGIPWHFPQILKNCKTMRQLAQKSTTT